MENLAIIGLVIYITAMSIVAVIITIADKFKAMHGLWRIPENVLLSVAILGGAFAEYVTMRIIHHKTLHKKFMIGLPTICIFHVAVLILFVENLI